MFTGARRDSSLVGLEALAVTVANHDDNRRRENNKEEGDQFGSRRKLHQHQGRGSLSYSRRLRGGGGGRDNVAKSTADEDDSSSYRKARGSGNVNSVDDYDLNSFAAADDDERQHFLNKNKNKTNGGGGSKKSQPPTSKSTSAKVHGERPASSSSTASLGKNNKRAKLAKQETLEGEGGNSSCANMFFRVLKRKRIYILPLIIISCIAAIYCIPYVEIEPRIPKRLPHIPFNFREGPLRPSSASQFKIDRLFKNQIYGPESVALDSFGNMYMAIEGGFILYAHLNKSSPPKRSYYFGDSPTVPVASSQFDYSSDLVKIAELNGIKQIPYYSNGNSNNNNGRARGLRDSAGSWRRECQLDEKIYGPNLHYGGQPSLIANSGNGDDGFGLTNAIDSSSSSSSSNELNLATQADNSNSKGEGSDDYEQLRRAKKFVSNIKISRCSKPLGVRLSPDENYLYVVDTLSGLYRVSLMISERPHSSQRLVTKLIDFRNNRHQLLPVIQFDNQLPGGIQLDSSVAASASASATNSINNNNNNNNGPTNGVRARTSSLNISLMAVDDLTIDYGAGTRGGDMIYLSDASQNWNAISFFYDMLEGRPTGAILRYDTGSNQLSVFSPNRVAHVRTSTLELSSDQQQQQQQSDAVGQQHNYNDTTTTITSVLTATMIEESMNEPYLGMGAPRLDENDVFDDRPLHFPNGVQLTDDKQAILIADSLNKRIIKHYIRGSRRGTSDLWAWTPNYPDNIRRGIDKRQETYWVIGCGEDETDKVFDILEWLKGWPRLRKYILKNYYLLGWIIESIGQNLLGSTKVIDYGYSHKVGASVLNQLCAGMMILQYNKHGDIIRSIHSKEFPKDLACFSQVNEVIDANNQEHILYLSSPSYKFVTKLTLPTDSFDLPSTSS